jgi:hypothetical protein
LNSYFDICLRAFSLTFLKISNKTRKKMFEEKF